jgi:hypothetical protein
MGDRELITMNTDISTELDLERLLNDSEDVYLHIVGYWEWLFVEKLRRKVPRALCGELLIADLDKPAASPASPHCPNCLAIAGSADGVFVPGHDI